MGANSTLYLIVKVDTKFLKPDTYILHTQVILTRRLHLVALAGAFRYDHLCVVAFAFSVCCATTNNTHVHLVILQ